MANTGDKQVSRSECIAVIGRDMSQRYRQGSAICPKQRVGHKSEQQRNAQAARRLQIEQYQPHHPATVFSLDINKHFVYGIRVIQSFASAETEQFFATGKSRRFPQNILKRAAMRSTQLDGATCLDDLRIPPANRLEASAHDRAGQWSIRVNDQWRVCFRFKKGDAFDVEIVDYH